MGRRCGLVQQWGSGRLTGLGTLCEKQPAFGRRCKQFVGTEKVEMEPVG